MSGMEKSKIKFRLRKAPGSGSGTLRKRQNSGKEGGRASRGREAMVIRNAGKGGDVAYTLLLYSDGPPDGGWYIVDNRW